MIFVNPRACGQREAPQIMRMKGNDAWLLQDDACARADGVMTFLVNHVGTVYQKDLGSRTEWLARRISSFDPDQTWKKVDAANP